MDKKRRKLSRREKKVLTYLSQGYTNPKIAEELSLSVGTIQKVVNELMNRTDTLTKAHLVYYAVKEGLIK